jgi:hypothetical protein
MEALVSVHLRSFKIAMNKLCVFLLLVSVVFSSCETDVELNAPYKNTTVIFALLDPDANGDNVINLLDTQWVRINKTFLGEGNNNVYAGIRDSSEYDEADFEKKVVQRIVDGEVIEEYELIAKEVANRDMFSGGIFYGPEQTAYYFLPSAPGLNQSSSYRISLKFRDGREVTGETAIVSYSSFAWITPQANATLIMANVASNGGVLFTPEVSVRWNAATNANIYDTRLRFHYTELLYDNDGWEGTPVSTTAKYIDYFIGSVSKTVIMSGEQLKLTFDGESFYSLLKNNLEQNPRIRRIIGDYDSVDQRTECFDVLLTMGNDDLKSYIEVNSPATGIVQERPIYTNINNGIGLFASRGSRNLTNLPLIAIDNNNQENPGNLYAFVSELVATLNFCDPNGSSNFSCNN